MMMRALLLTALLMPSMAIAAPSEKPETAAIRAVKAVLNDPDSAKFRNIRRTSDDGYCGWVNAKNSFGGYAGDQLFTDVSGVVQLLDETSAIEMRDDPTFGPDIKPCIFDAPSLRAIHAN